MTEKPTPNKKPWLRRKRVWCIVIVLLPAYFCLVPSRTRISPGTTGITGPLTADGKVDYFAAFEKLYIDKLSPPEDNGLRYMIAACGPTILEQMYIADTVPWEEMPTHEQSKNWFETRWIPLCEHLYIDPYRRPMFYDSRGFYGFMRQYKIKQKEATGEENVVDDDPDDQKLWNKLVVAPWKVEDEPVVAKWLEEYSPVLDYFGECVRKPHYTCWRWRAGHLFSVLLPDVQAHRDFARSLRVRVAERVGRGDLDGAWHDVMSMKHIAVHYKDDPICVTNLVGIAIDGMANEAAQLILTHGKPTEEQLTRFLRDLNALPRPNALSFRMTLERMGSYELLQLFKSGQSSEFYEDMKNVTGPGQENLQTIMTLLYLPFDANIAGERLSELYGEFGLKDFSFDQHQGSNPVLCRDYVDRIGEAVSHLQTKLKNTQLHRIPLIRTRSRLLAEYVFSYTATAVQGPFGAFNRIEAENEMLKLALALEHEKLVRGEYPARLDALVPEYFLMQPLDPYTGRANFVYQITPHGEHPFVLYSYGPNGKDDGGLPMEKAMQARNADYDIVFWK
ncbi:MAG: type II secretion system protein GspG [Planctomycetaceae bacterium]|nr:type II secretion system protein GspG [Planctomycetaceae bacterium]